MCVSSTKLIMKNIGLLLVSSKLVLKLGELPIRFKKSQKMKTWKMIKTSYEKKRREVNSTTHFNYKSWEMTYANLAL